ncbi:3'-5' exonuclease [Mangrovicoccus ximenensis]|uniref:3'-5' exonuclease n=1 Tax=Mangrovicoccus ximenensis TaxID=1911570 RepID=UPI001F47CAC8|nr:3'-5' exonuclease [Mangrovicoccus ximenensis]
MQAFLAAMRREPSRLCGIAALLGLLQEQQPNRWTDLIAEGITALADELGTKTMPVPDLVEWFGEWARDTRGEQRGLLLLTAHRAKGLEFDHVVILDGGWQRPSEGEDADAPRRLDYVAMTRARRSLALISQGRTPFLAPLGGLALRRKVAPERPSVSLCRSGRRRRRRLRPGCGSGPAGDPWSGMSGLDAGALSFCFNGKAVAFAPLSGRLPSLCRSFPEKERANYCLYRNKFLFCIFRLLRTVCARIVRILRATIWLLA